MENFPSKYEINFKSEIKFKSKSGLLQATLILVAGLIFRNDLQNLEISGNFRAILL